MNFWKLEIERLAGSCGDRQPGEVIDDLCALARVMGDEAAEALLDSHPDLFQCVPALTQAFHQHVASKEIGEAGRLLHDLTGEPVPFATVASAATLHSYNRVHEMFDRLNFQNCRRFVMVGCGWLPETLFHVQDRTQVPEIVGIDIAPEAVATANEVATRLGYMRVRAEHADGCSYDYGGTQIIFVTNMVSGKHGVLSRIAATAPENVQIVLREPYSLRRLWSESGTHALDPQLEIAGLGSGSPTLARDVYVKRRRQ